MQTEEEIRELLKGEFYVDIVNFEKHHPKGNTTQFVKLRTDWYHDVKFCGVPPAAQLLWVKLLAFRGTCVGLMGPFRMTSVQLRYGFRGTSVGLSLVTLWKHKLISLDKNRIDKNIYKKRKKPSAVASEIAKPFKKTEFNFERLYEKYPRK